MALILIIFYNPMYPRYYILSFQHVPLVTFQGLTEQWRSRAPAEVKLTSQYTFYHMSSACRNKSRKVHLWSWGFRPSIILRMEGSWTKTRVADWVNVCYSRKETILLLWKGWLLFPSWMIIIPLFKHVQKNPEII